MKQKMTIGVLAKKAHVGIETIRFYQRKNILTEPKTSCGFREYSDSDLKKLQFIKKAQKLGFTLKSIKDLLSISVCNSKSQPYLAKICDEKMQEITEKIESLKEMKKMLTEFSKRCASKNKNSTECEFLSCFEKKWQCCPK